MKNFKVIIFLISCFLGAESLFAAVAYTSPQVMVRESSDVIGYDFFGVVGAFGRVDVLRISEFSKDDFERMIISSIPKRYKTLKRRAISFLRLSLDLAAKYKVDPFWVLAVMWTESNFNPNAVSYVNARGPMQIMPGTGRFLARIIKKRKVSRRMAYRMIRNPRINIQMGIIYLKYLLEMFNYDYKMATVSYNMGPGWTKKRIRYGQQVGEKNRYFNKVTKAYRLITSMYKVATENLPYMYIAQTLNSTNDQFKTLPNSNKNALVSLY